MTLETRVGLPDALRVLARDYPRDMWESHRNFDALTRFWLDRHLGFRADLAEIERAAQGFLGGAIDTPAYAQHSRRLIGGLLNGLHGHHQVEDQHYFPLLAGLDARLEAGFTLLDADHQALDGHIHGLAEATNAMLRALQAGADRVAVGRVHDRVQGFARFIDRHLVDEEELVIPTILHYAPDL